MLSRIPVSSWQCSTVRRLTPPFYFATPSLIIVQGMIGIDGGVPLPEETWMTVILVNLRWLARLSGLLVAGAYVLLVIGDITQPHSGAPSTLIEWTGIVLLTATCAGMIVAWRWELTGALMSLISLLAFTVLIRMGHHGVLFVLAAPGILYVLDWLLRRRERVMPVSGT